MVASATTLRVSSIIFPISTSGCCYSWVTGAASWAVYSYFYPVFFALSFFYLPVANAGLSGKASLYIWMIPSRSFISLRRPLLLLSIYCCSSFGFISPFFTFYSVYWILSSFFFLFLSFLYMLLTKGSDVSAHWSALGAWISFFDLVDP